MATLKELRNRIASVKSTQKITSAMKMVAAAKLRKAQLAAEAARPFSERLERMVGTLASSVADPESGPKMLSGTGGEDVHLFVIVSSDRGLCGGFNGNVVREARNRIRAEKEKGRTVKLLFLGRKARDVLKRDFPGDILDTIEGLTRTGAQFGDASDISLRLMTMFDGGEFDRCTMIYTKFKSAMTQTVQVQQLIPFAPVKADEESEQIEAGAGDGELGGATFDFEPSEEEILEALLPRNLAVQLFKALLESNASEQGARMTAMDSATRNAGDMIDSLTLTYNRTRQANITKELIEIISGAEAL